jgi:hypothetical protein
MGEQAWGALSNCTKPSSGSYFAAAQPLELAHCPNFERMVEHAPSEYQKALPNSQAPSLMGWLAQSDE